MSKVSRVSNFLKNYWGCLFYLILISLIAGTLLYLRAIDARKESELEGLCISVGYDGLIQDERGVYWCTRVVDGEYEQVLVKTVQYYEREGQ